MRLRWLFGLALATALSACGSGDAGSKEPGIAAAWFYLSDTQDYQNIPDAWQQVDFTPVDTLYVGPAGIQEDGRFGLYQSDTTGSLNRRFEWLVERARQDNPAVRIVISQWWGDGDGIWGRPLDALSTPQDIDAYAQSVAGFIEHYQVYAGGRYAIDGFDIDYESENVIPAFPLLAERVQQSLQALSAKYGKRFLFTLSPADDEYLTAASLARLDYVNMQSYAGGIEIPPDAFAALGVPNGKILYGICPETDCETYSVDEVLAVYRTGGLAGIHLWRLNSDNSEYEQSVQRQIHAALHP